MSDHPPLQFLTESQQAEFEASKTPLAKVTKAEAQEALDELRRQHECGVGKLWVIVDRRLNGL